MTTQPLTNELIAGLHGTLITQDDPDYDKARAVFYTYRAKRPAFIVKAAGVDDVVRVVNFARENGLELAVRGGGHSAAGHGVTEGGVVLDMSGMQGLEIDANKRTAWAEAGLTAGAYTQAAGDHGLATGFGDTGTVGLGGLTLGGGVGYLVRKYGLTIDSLLAADVVTADGRLRHIDESHDPDLFWAIRGGGGNFGVATRFQYRLHPVNQIVGGMLILPATPETISGFMEAADAAPEELGTIANVMPAPPMPGFENIAGKMVIFAMLVWAGDLDAGEKALAPFRKLATPLMDMLGPKKYPEIFAGPDGPHPVAAAARNMHINFVDRASAQAMLDRLAASNASMRVVQMRALGGAMARVPALATAYAHRKAKIMVNVAALFENMDDEPRHADWVAGMASALDQGEPGVYVNFLNEEFDPLVKNAYPGLTGQRLAEIKRKYDPANLFHVNHNIKPAE
jgi:FAD/FMN-containing dehydrogenase